MPDLSIDLIVVSCLAFFVLIQLIYFVFIFSRLAFFKVKDAAEMESQIPITANKSLMIYITPCASMASATFTKPAILAPFT